METSASDVWQDDRMSWVEWVNQPLFLLCQLRHMEPAMARHVSPQSEPCFSSSREGGQQRLFLAWSNSPVSLWYIYMETCCFMLFLFLYVIQVVDWGLRLSLLLSLSDCFYDTFIFILVLFLSRALAWLTWHVGWGRVLNHWTNHKLCFMAPKIVASGVKSCSGWRCLRKTFCDCEFCGGKLLTARIDWTYSSE